MTVHASCWTALTCGKWTALSMHVLLCCLEEALKRNGDVKLAGLTPPAKAGLQMAGVDRVFEIYDSHQ